MPVKRGRDHETEDEDGKHGVALAQLGHQHHAEEDREQQLDLGLDDARPVALEYPR